MNTLKQRAFNSTFRVKFLRDNPEILLDAFELLEECVDAYGDEYFTEQEMSKDTIDKFRSFMESLRTNVEELRVRNNL